MKSKIILSLLLLSFSGTLFAEPHVKDNRIAIHLVNKQYRHLQLVIISGRNQIVTFDGKVDGHNNWTFVYPDSLYEKFRWMEIEVPGSIDTVKEMIAFKTVINSDTLEAGSFDFSRGITHITAYYINSRTIPHMLFLNRKTKKPEMAKLIDDQFMVSPKSDKELISSIASMGYHFGFIFPNVPYETQLQKFRDLIKKYPDSHNLICFLSQSFTRFKSKADVESLYSQFSEKNRQSFFGEKINRYLNTNKFVNTELPDWKTGAMEPIVENHNEYTLVVFSASWCVPCQKIIPLLKQVYGDLKGKLNMVDVSVDDSTTVKNWRKQMKDDHIPWRSVLAEHSIDQIKKKYYVQGIPDMILVAPDGLMRKIDIRDTTQRKELYQLVEKKK